MKEIQIFYDQLTITFITSLFSFSIHNLQGKLVCFCITADLYLHLTRTSVLQKSLSWACRPWGTVTCSALRHSSYRWSFTLHPKATNATWAARWAAIPSLVSRGIEITSVWTPIPTITSPTHAGFAPCWSCEWGPKTWASTASQRRTRWDGQSAPPCSVSKVSERETYRSVGFSGWWNSDTHLLCFPCRVRRLTSPPLSVRDYTIRAVRFPWQLFTGVKIKHYSTLMIWLFVICLFFSIKEVLSFFLCLYHFNKGLTLCL